MSTIALAASGGDAPRSCSRAIRPITSAIGASSLDLMRAWPRWSERWRHRAARLSATPAMRRAPSASTRTCSTASKIARAVSPRGHAAQMGLAVVMAQLQRHRIGLAAHAADILDRQVAGRHGDARLAAQQRAAVGHEGDVHFLARHRPHGGGGDAPEFLDRRSVLGHLGHLVSAACRPCRSKPAIPCRSSADSTRRACCARPRRTC